MSRRIDVNSDDTVAALVPARSGDRSASLWHYRMAFSTLHQGLALHPVPAGLHFGLAVPKRALDEIVRRNSSAHKFVMAKESTADAQELADRLAIVQTLLVAIVAEYVGFKGPIVGWEWIRGRRKIPDDWWHSEGVPEAALRYLVVPDDDGAPKQ